MALKPKIEKRVLLKALHDSKSRKPIPITPEIKAGGERLLDQAKQDYANRQTQADKNIKDYAWEAASYIRSKARNAAIFIGCGIGPGYSLGPGRHRYYPGKGWVKIGG